MGVPVSPNTPAVMDFSDVTVVGGSSSWTNVSSPNIYASTQISTGLIVPYTTGGFAISNHANSQTNFSLTDAGALTLAAGLTATTGVFAGGSNIAPPSFTTRSIGTRVVIYPNITSSTVDYALGIDYSTLWFSTQNTSSQFAWYGGTTLAATLSGVGALTLAGGLTATTGVAGGNGTSAGLAGLYGGNGAPTFSAPNGSIYLRYDGTPGSTCFYINTSGASSTGTTWTAKF